MIIPLLCFLLPLAAGAKGITGTDLTTTNNLSKGRIQVCKVSGKDTAESGTVSQRIGGSKSAAGQTLGDAIGSSGPPQALVTDLRYWSNPDYTRIAVTLDREVTFTPHKLRL